MRKKTFHRKPESLGNILQKILKKMDVSLNRTDRRIVDLWRNAVGPQIAARTIPETFKRGSLHVLVSSTSWLHQLQFLKEEILLKLNELSGKDEFRRLQFSIGEFPEQSAVDSAAKPADTAVQELCLRDRQMIVESLAVINDPELREAIRKTMVTEISRRREIQRRKGL
jgi:hypothetical protein